MAQRRHHGGAFKARLAALCGAGRRPEFCRLVQTDAESRQEIYQKQPHPPVKPKRARQKARSKSPALHAKTPSRKTGKAAKPQHRRLRPDHARPRS